MNIPNWLWWLLAASVFIGVIVMISAFLIMRNRIKLLHSKSELESLKNKTKLGNKALDRKTHGELLWDLKNVTKNPLPDLSLEFVLNTILRNEYKTFWIDLKRKYEKESIEKIGKAEYNSQNFDFALIFSGQDVNKVFDNLYKKLNQSGMIVIYNQGPKDEIKKLKSYLKFSQIKNESANYNKGLILIVK